jgi:hypothetical protein
MHCTSFAMTCVPVSNKDGEPRTMHMQEQEMPRKLAEAAVRMRRASARLDVLPTAARRRGFADAEFLPDVVLGVQLIDQLPLQICLCTGAPHQTRLDTDSVVCLSGKPLSDKQLSLSFRMTM